MNRCLARAWRAIARFALVALCATAPVAPAADPPKVLRVAIPSAETSFDPAFVSDAASDSVISNVFDAMLDYDYLARPVKLVPRALDALPTIEDGGRTFVCHVRKGVYFTPDPAFKGRARELTATDFAYGLKRILDPRLKSPWLWLLDGKVVGATEAREKAEKSGKFDYDAALPGLEVVDRYTLRIRLTAPDLRFPYLLAVPNMAAQAREVVEAYGADIGAHPVGTGPYMLGEYRRSARTVLIRNPKYRDVTYVAAGPVPAAYQPIAASLEGRKLPLADRVEINVIEEGHAELLAFLNGELDLMDILPIDLTDQALDAEGKLRPDLAARGIGHEVLLRPNTWWIYFNMKDPVVGGYAPDKIALRRAISMAYNVDEAIRVLLKNRAVKAYGPIPPGIAGYDTDLHTQAQVYDPAMARALLDRFGYKDRDGDGYREMPDGKPLVIERWSVPNSAQRDADELWKKSLDSIGLRTITRKDRLPELRKMARLGKIPVRADGWNADYPDAENFMQLLYGPNVGQENQAQFDLPEFNKLYEQARALPDSPERTRLFDRMTELVIAYAPWKMTYHRLEDMLRNRWVKSYVPHPIRSQAWQYADIDPSQRPQSVR